MLRLARLPSRDESQSESVNSIFPVGNGGVFERISLIQRSNEPPTATAHHQWFAKPVSPKQFLSFTLPQPGGEITVISISPSSGQILALLNVEKQLSLCKFSPISNRWEAVAAMNACRHLLSFSGAVIGDFFYVAGGVLDNGHGVWLRPGISQAERLDLSSNRWETLPAMHYPHSFTKGFVLDGRFYVIHFSLDERRSAEIYDPLTNLWTFVPQFLPEDVERFGMAVMKNELYMLKWSGVEPSGTLMRYDKSTGEWIYVGAVPEENSKYCVRKKLCPVGNELWILDCEHRELWSTFEQVYCETSVWPVIEGPSFWPRELEKKSDLEPHKFIHACKIGGAAEASLWRTIPIFRL